MTGDWNDIKPCQLTSARARARDHSTRASNLPLLSLTFGTCSCQTHDL